MGKLKSKYKIDDSDFVTERQELYDVYLNECLNDENLSDEERDGLDHLRILLDISDEYATSRLEKEEELIYRRKLQCVVADGKIDEKESEELDAMKKNLDIDDFVAQDTENNEVFLTIQKYVDSLLDKRRMSCDEEKKLYKMAKDLHTNITFEGDGLKRIKLFWQIENTELPNLKSDIELENEEKLYFKTSSALYEDKMHKNGDIDEGITSKMSICKGFYIYPDSINPSIHIDEYLKLVDEGNIYITNKRLIFKGEHGIKSIPLTTVTSYIPYNNAIEIEEEGEKSKILKLDDVELTGMYLSRAINDL